MNSNGTLLLTRKEVASLLSFGDCIEVVEQAFRLHGEGKTTPPAILGIHASNGGFHVKAGLMDLKHSYFVAKANANFPNNAQVGLPTIQGVIIVCDAHNGRVLALMDSIEITILRTGAATAVAARYLAKGDSRTITICGCGNQGRISLTMLQQILPLETAFAYDINETWARRFADDVSRELKIAITPISDLSHAVPRSDIVVTCTPSKRFFLKREDISDGTFVAAVGADSSEKQEVEPDLLKVGKVVVDVVEQAATIGDLHHALNRGSMSRADVYAELGEIVSGAKVGRTSDNEIIIFDSTGMALQDVASAALVYERAVERGRGMIIDIGG